MIICWKGGVVSRKSKFTFYAKFWLQKIHSKAKKTVASLLKNMGHQPMLSAKTICPQQYLCTSPKAAASFYMRVKKQGNHQASDLDKSSSPAKLLGNSFLAPCRTDLRKQKKPGPSWDAYTVIFLFERTFNSVTIDIDITKHQIYSRFSLI